MTWPITTVAIRTEDDVAYVRQVARRTAQLLGFATEDQTRIATAVSEIGRNALSYGGGGRAEISIRNSRPVQRLLVRIADKGPGIDNLEAVLGGRHRSAHGLGLGVLGAQRLMDGFQIDSSPAGTCVELEKALLNQPILTAQGAARVAERLAEDVPTDPAAEVRQQNQELLRALQINTERQIELVRLNAELEETNRGVVALYAELDRRAEQLQAFNASLETRVLAAIEERDRSESQLRQAQKMEALGQLTGGVAHDFNNLLQVVMGNLEMMQRDLPAEGRARRAAGNAMEGARRAAILTNRLLSFSRLQPLNPSSINVDQLTRGMFDILRRTLGERFDLRVEVDEDLWFAEADAHQLENAILNLAVNARHAMQDGGEARIGAYNLPESDCGPLHPLAAGDYVAVYVADCGSGMAPEVLARVFEPFFTTKEVGHGTGLGLSQVHGFAKQSGGDVRIESALGVGTTVTLYLPRASGPPSAIAAADADQQLGARRGERILVVEDDEQVRNYTTEALSELGYEVHAAEDGSAALALIDTLSTLDLLLTDVVLPGSLSGRDLADRARVARPRLKVLFASGYARDAMMHGGRLDLGIDMLQKPFTYEQLATRVRIALGAAGPA